MRLAVLHNLHFYNERTRSLEEPLPWEHTTPGVNKAFLRHEYEQALKEELTADCRRGKCTGCGICPNLGVNIIDWGEKDV